MRWVRPWLLFLGMVTYGCASSPTPRTGTVHASGKVALDPPFEAIHPVRGPGLHVNGMTLVGDRGTFRMAIGAFDHGREIVFVMFKTHSTPADWLDACPRSARDPREPRLVVALEGVGDVSRNALYEGEHGWTTSISIEQYVRLPTLRFDVCGSRYALAREHDPRLALHARIASERAARKNQEEAALPGACHDGDGAACRESGALALDPQEQRRLYKQACILHDLDGCSRFADMLLQGKGGGKDPDQAIGLLRQACQKGHDGACLRASRAVISHPSAWPAPSAEGRYREGAMLARRACELAGSTLAVSCLLAAKLHATGFGVAADPERVSAFAERSCSHGFEEACRLRRHLSACASGSGEACAALADAERKGRWRGLSDDGKEALWRLSACKRGHSASCADRSQ